MNVILVVFDSLRKDCIGAYGSPFWGAVRTPHFDALAEESLVMTRGYPESLPTLPARRALYTGRRVYPFENGDFRLKGDFVGAGGWGPIPEAQDTLAEVLRERGYRTALISDVYHQFKPSKNFWRGFDQWMFLRGQEKDPMRSGPRLTQEEIDYWLPREAQTPGRIAFVQQCIMNIRDRTKEEDFFAARVLSEAALWLQQNRDADRFFLTIESFDPHEPWLVPEQYRRMYDPGDGPEQICSGYHDCSAMAPELLKRTQANYSGLVTFCDRWFGHFMEQVRVLGLLENTVLVFTSDHGHSIGDFNYLGKRGYPSRPEVFDVPIMIRHPRGKGAGERSDLLVQHTDITAQILEFAGVRLPDALHGELFFERALAGGPALRDHVTIGWGAGVTLVNDRWWFNAKVNGKGAFLYDLTADEPFAENAAGARPDVMRQLFDVAAADAGGSFPDWLVDLADRAGDSPGCSDLAARK